MTRKDWPALKTEAVARVAAGGTMQQVARELDVSFSAVQAWCAKAGVRSRWAFPLPTRERQRLTAEYAASREASLEASRDANLGKS